MKDILQALAEIIKPLLDALKSLITVIFIKKNAETEIKNEQLTVQNKTQKEQLDVAARPPRPWNAILDLMRQGKR